MSHFLYIFFVEHGFTVFLLPFIAINVFLFFRHKKYLEERVETLINL
jgi:hypothetical protein